MKLLVKWNESEHNEYPIDDGEVSPAITVGNLIILDIRKGLFYFNKNSLIDGTATDGVSVSDGFQIKFTTIDNWTIID